MYNYMLLVRLMVCPIQIYSTESTVPDISTFPTSYLIQLHLHQASTGNLHPEAKHPVITVTHTRWERPAVGIEIVGDNLVLILAYKQNPYKPDDQVFVYEWKTGRMKMVRHIFSSLF